MQTFKWIGRHPATVQATLAVVLLLVGALVYVFDRNPETTYFLPEALSVSDRFVPVFGQLGSHLPDLLHVYAFILLSCALLRPDHPSLLKISGFWLLLESLFEIGQHSSVSPFIVENTPQWFLHVPVLENWVAYFAKGTFDPLDLLAILVGALAGYLTVKLMPSYHQPNPRP